MYVQWRQLQKHAHSCCDESAFLLGSIPDRVPIEVGGGEEKEQLSGALDGN